MDATEVKVNFFETYKHLIGQSVRVESIDRTFTSGILYSIDPETDHLALLCSIHSHEQLLHLDGWSVKILMGHQLHSVYPLSEDENDSDAGEYVTLEMLQTTLGIDASTGDTNHTMTVETHELRVEQLCQFLGKHFIPYEVIPQKAEKEGATSTTVTHIQVFGGAATLVAPFSANSIECNNEQILSRLQQLLYSFDKWLLQQ